MKPRLLIISLSSYENLTDINKWCQYLRDQYDITYLCKALVSTPKHNNINIEGINIQCVPWSDRKIIRVINFLYRALSETYSNYDICLIEHFPSCFIIKMFGGCNKYMLDIRTASVAKSPIKRFVEDTFLKLEAALFKNKTIIAEALADKFGINAQVLPVGADSILCKNSNYSGLKLIYIGTLENRDIDKTIKGLSYFYESNHDRINLSYTIIGTGRNSEENNLQELVDQLRLVDIVNILGYIKHEDLGMYLSDSNIGVSFIPLTSYFDFQPPTKTFEYLLSGLPVIATKTHENRRVINDTNGVLIEDTPEDFCRGLELVCERLNSYNSELIRDDAREYSWENITLNFLKPYLNSVLQQ